MIKVIAMDMDGTLLSSDHRILPHTKEVLLRAQHAGIELMLASGRPLPGLFHQAAEMGFDVNHLSLLAYNGAVVIDAKTKELIVSETLDLTLAQAIVDHMKSHDVNVMVYDDTTLYATKGDGYNVQHEADSNGLKLVVHPLDKLWFNPHKILVSEEPRRLDALIPTLKAPFLDQADFVKSAPFYLECLVKGIHKGHALEQYCLAKSIDPMEVVAFGDNYNDLTMIQYAGMGVAMGNAVDDVKIAANHVTKHHDEDGIAHFLESQGL